MLGSACLHVVLHVLLKRARDRTSFVWWMWFWASLFFLPVPLRYWQAIPASTWGLLVVSALFEALYYVSITRAYKEGDLSVVYPLARGTAPLFILLWSVLFLRERVSLGGVLGIAIVALGLYAINLPRLSAWKNAWRSFGQPAARLALLSGLCISLYTTLDKVGVRSVVPQTYTYLAMTLTLVWLTPPTLKEVGVAGLLAELRSSRWSSVVAGLFAMSAYGIVLFAMQVGAQASYAGAVREISIVFGAAAGILLLKEAGSMMRLVGAALIAVGVATIALFG
ncbi:MAG: DMT family transporter [Polyangiales bacterium]